MSRENIYNKLKEHIGKRYRRNTVIIDDIDSIIVRLYSTNIVTIQAHGITLNHGGHTTSTTKNRMNQVAELLDYKFHVHQISFNWYIKTREDTLEFDKPTTLSANLIQEIRYKS